ncbi:MAG TPA: isochorismatase family protein [Vicinamibacterales bacterium]|nr:isochorismatase family protein [Vicinamibacterales bacterium]
MTDSLNAVHVSNGRIEIEGVDLKGPSAVDSDGGLREEKVVQAAVIPPHQTVLVVIDPQRAFVDPAGSLWRTHGVEELRPCLEALDRLRAFVAAREHPGLTIWVRSEYVPGQFTGGDLSDGMAQVCVPGANVDCEWASGVAESMSPHDLVVTKRHDDAWRSAEFRSAIEDAVRGGVTRIAVVGFQFTTCVVASALSTQRAVRDRGVRVAVIEALTGSRASSHLPGASGLSRMEATRRQLTAAGVEII